MATKLPKIYAWRQPDKPETRYTTHVGKPQPGWYCRAVYEGVEIPKHAPSPTATTGSASVGSVLEIRNKPEKKYSGDGEKMVVTTKIPTPRFFTVVNIIIIN